VVDIGPPWECFSRVTQSDQRKRNDVIWEIRQLSHAFDSLSQGIDPEPNGSKAFGMGRQQKILRSR